MTRLAPCLAVFCLAAATASAQDAVGSPPKAWLGVTLGQAEAPLGESDSPFAFEDDARATGVLITGVAKASPADKFGLRAGDVVHTVNGEPVGSPDELVRMVGKLEEGSWVEIALTRQGRERTLDARLGPRPEGRMRLDLKRGWAGFVPLDVPRQLQEFWGGEDGAGVLVGAVMQTGPAEVAGLLPGDLVVAVDGKPVTAVHELLRRIVSGGVGNELELRVSRQGTFLDVEVEIVEEPPREELERLAAESGGERRRRR